MKAKLNIVFDIDGFMTKAAFVAKKKDAEQVKSDYINNIYKIWRRNLQGPQPTIQELQLLKAIIKNEETNLPLLDENLTPLKDLLEGMARDFKDALTGEATLINPNTISRIEKYPATRILGYAAISLYNRYYPYRPGVDETTTKLKNQGHGLSILTRRGFGTRQDIFGEKTRANLNQTLDYRGVARDRTLFTNTDKVIECLELNADIVGDDDPHNIIALRAAGLPVIRLHNKHNKQLKYPGEYVVSSWEDNAVYDIIQEVSEKVYSENPNREVIRDNNPELALTKHKRLNIIYD